jgi:tRNA A37 methylthiotransferase MiaB
MNVADSQVVESVLQRSGFERSDDPAGADVILLNTCAIREKAEKRIWQRLSYFRSLRNGASTRAVREGRAPVVGVLGCMAERIKSKLLEADRLADLIAGPDAYRDLPSLIDAVRGGEKAMNVQLSAEETYADIVPVRESGNVTAFVTAMRGCDNMCSFCIVPFTRGRERSRSIESIAYEVQLLSEKGVKEVTLLGQNVNSYADTSHLHDNDEGDEEGESLEHGRVESGKIRSAAGTNGAAAIENGLYADGFTTRYDPGKKRAGARRFAELLRRVSMVDPEMRVRFTSPHPKDFPDEVLDEIKDRPNICMQLHMPAQSGSTTCLQRMNRGYTREALISLIHHARERLGSDASITTDVIAGFCGETEEEHEDTVSLMREAAFDQAFMFAYSERNGTIASSKFPDDVPENVKKRRLNEVISTFRSACEPRFMMEVGKRHCVLVEGTSKKDSSKLYGKTDNGKIAVFPDEGVVHQYEANVREGAGQRHLKPGDYAAVDIESATTGTLHGRAVGKTTLMGFQMQHGSQNAQAMTACN